MILLTQFSPRNINFFNIKSFNLLKWVSEEYDKQAALEQLLQCDNSTHRSKDTRADQHEHHKLIFAWSVLSKFI